MTRKVPTHEEARAILSRFNASHWNNPGEHARYSIPARPGHDDDIQLAEYINAAEQQSARIAELEAERDTVRKALAAWVEELRESPVGRDIARELEARVPALLAAAREGGAL